MQIFKNKLTTISDPAAFGLDCPLSDLVLLDIETTGLSAINDSIILIGCVCFDSEYADNNDGEMIQIFADTPDEEPEIIKAFSDIVKDRKTLVHFNGDRFDVPFIRKSSEKYGIDDPMTGMESVDLYKPVSRFRNMLGLIDCKQQTVEDFLGTERTEHTTGRNVVREYADYVKTASSDDLTKIIDHNASDLEGLVSLLPLLSYSTLFSSAPGVYRAEADSYSDASGVTREEVVLRFHSDINLPKPVFGTKDGCFFKAVHSKGDSGEGGTEGIVKIPLVSKELRYFYADYKNYYYFPEQDQALHRSIASFTEKTHRIPASPENCYTRKSSSFLPEWDAFRDPFFKEKYDSATLWFELTPEIKKDRTLLSEYALYVMKHILEKSSK